MKTRAKAILTVLLAVLILLPVFTSCATDDKVSDNVLEVYGYKISRDEYTYYYRNYRKADPDADMEEIKDKCEEAIREAYALYMLADKVGYKLTDEDKAAIESDVAEGKSLYGEGESFETALEQANMTEDVYRRVIALQTLEISLRNFMSEESSGAIALDDETVENDVRENFIRIRQILISNDDGESTEENSALADAVCLRVNNGENFEALLKEFSEDEQQPADGYCFTYGQMIPEVENASKKLEENDVSGIVKSSVGFHIIKRLPITDEFISTNFEKLRYYYSCRVFNEKREKCASEIKVEYLPEFSTIDFD